MHDKLQLLLKQIKFPEAEYTYFEDGKLDKIVCNKTKDNYAFFIALTKILPVGTYKQFNELLKEGFKTAKVKSKISYPEFDMEKLTDYYRYFLEEYSKNAPLLQIFISSNLTLEDNKLIIEMANKAETMKFSSIKEELEKKLNNAGFSIKLTTKINKEKAEEIRKEIEMETTREIPKIEKKQNPIIMGTEIKSKPMNISDITFEMDDVTIEAKLFGKDLFESSKSAFKIITLKLYDGTDSIYCKIFCRDTSDFNNYNERLKEGNYYKIKGYSKNDKYSGEVVLNARNIVVSDKKDEQRMDKANEKRVELHAHTKMSQMDGVVEAKKLVQTAYDWGHKAIAITDHNSIQAFPEVFNLVNKLNEGKKDKFKVLYGAELTLIDDTVDIVIRSTKANLLDTTYVVFDFETTGFNAGGEDSIIEVGAVKICNGEIIDKFSELINPGKKLVQKITDITNITNDMLKGKDNEETVIKRFKEWYGDLPLVAHNAKFDMSFLTMAHEKYNLGEINNTIIDTLELSRTLDNNFARHSLSALVKRYEVPWDEDAHHRADYDAEGTALVFHKMLKKLESRNFEIISDLDRLVSKDEIHKFGNHYHVNVLAKNKTGLKNLFKLITLANTKYLYKTPRILRSEIEKHREGLLVGSGCANGEVFMEARSKSDEELTNIINFYDYVEVQPLEVYDHLLQMADFASKAEIIVNLQKIIKVAEDAGKIVIATGDVHHLNPEDRVYREIIVNQKVPGGGRHPLSRNNITKIPLQHLLTTEEMLESFSFLDKDIAKKIVIENPNKIADMAEEIEVIRDTKGTPFSPEIKDCTNKVKKIVYDNAYNMYGNPLPEIVADRLERELEGIISGGFDTVYLLSHQLVKKSTDEGYIVGSRGSVGSSFVATMMNITEVNPLAPHYVCKKCKQVIFEEDGRSFELDYSNGFDLPEKKCPKCGEVMHSDGHNMPFATFLGFNADKVPDIDLNFSGDYQAKAHEYTRELLGAENVYRAGTIGTVAAKTAFGYVKGYCEEKGISMKAAEIERLTLGCIGIKRTTGQHPGGIVVIPNYMDVYDFTPVQYPADDSSSTWMTTHIDYHPLEDNLLKLDILGHDDPTLLKKLGDISGKDIMEIPFNDEKVLGLFSSTKPLGVTESQIMCPTGAISIPEFGTKFTIQMLVDTRPTTFSELIKISGLSHGTDVWNGNAHELIKNGVATLKDILGCRDEVMTYLINVGIEPGEAFKISETVRKQGKFLTEQQKDFMRQYDIPEYNVEYFDKIKYMFPKAHATAYVMMALRAAWFKVYQPINYYAAYFSVRVHDFDIEAMIKGYDTIKKTLTELEGKGFDKSNKEEAISESLHVALEMTARGFKFGEIDLNKSDSKDFVIDEDGKTLIPPFRAIDGLGTIVANKIVTERERLPFLSIEDLCKRSKLSGTLIEKMRSMGILDGMDESSQLSLF